MLRMPLSATSLQNKPEPSGLRILLGCLGLLLVGSGCPILPGDGIQFHGSLQTVAGGVLPGFTAGDATVQISSHLAVLILSQGLTQRTFAIHTTDPENLGFTGTSDSLQISGQLRRSEPYDVQSTFTTTCRLRNSECQGLPLSSPVGSRIQSENTQLITPPTTCTGSKLVSYSITLEDLSLSVTWLRTPGGSRGGSGSSTGESPPRSAEDPVLADRAEFVGTSRHELGRQLIQEGPCLPTGGVL